MSMPKHSRPSAAALALGLWLCAAPAPAADTADDSITIKTKIALMTADNVNAFDLNVDTVNGVITLHGKVPTERDKVKAEKIASKIDGAKSVKNLLHVVPNARREVAERADDEVKAAVEAAFKNSPRVAGSGITVGSVDKGVVKLAGRPNNLESLLESVQVANSVKGVRRVESDVEVIPGI